VHCKSILTRHLPLSLVSAEILWCSLWSRSMMLWSLHRPTENTRIWIIFKYYDLYNHDRPTSSSAPRTHFVNLAEFYGINNLESRIVRGHSEVVDFCTSRNRVYDFLLVLNSNLGPILPRFRDIKAFVRRKPLFRYPPLFQSKFQGVPLGVDPWCRGLQRANIPVAHAKLH